jgi:uncharacterized protein (TIGR02646 family)
MQRIEPAALGMKVEHWVAQSADPTRDLDYSNLLGACLGGDGVRSRPSERYCDTARGDAPLHVNPAGERDCARFFKYEATGTIKSENDGAKRDIETLNLNIVALQSARKAVLDGIRDWADRQKGKIPKATLQERADRWRKAKDDRLEPYCEVAIYWLEKKARQRP